MNCTYPVDSPTKQCATPSLENPFTYIFGIVLPRIVQLPFTPSDKSELRLAIEVFIKDRTSAIKRYGTMDTWITTQITDFSYLFTGYTCNFLFDNKTDIISDWDTSNVTTMRTMFGSAKYFNQQLNWKTSKVTDMSFMFAHCDDFNQPLYWDVSNVKKMTYMFYHCIKFDQHLPWDVSNVENMNSIFTYCYRLDQDFQHWDIGNVNNYDPTEIFRGTRTINYPLRLPRLEWSIRKKYIMLEAGTEQQTLGKFNSHTEMYLFNDEIMKEIASMMYIYPSDTSDTSNTSTSV